VHKQEKVALAYLYAFVKESVEPGSGYLPLFRDYRKGRQWLPELVYLNQFHESSAVIVCEYDEDLDLSTGTLGVDSIKAKELSLWKEGRIPKKWGNQRNNGVFLGWNNTMDSVPGTYSIIMDSSFMQQVSGKKYLSFLAADAQTGAGEREEVKSQASEAKSEIPDEEDEEEKGNKDGKDDQGVENSGAKNKETKDKGDKEKEKGDKEGKVDEEEDEARPMDFSLVLTDRDSVSYRVNLADYQRLQPPIKPEVYKTRLFWEDPESEVILQYVAIPLEGFLSDSGMHIVAGEIRGIHFEFDQGEKGAVILDQIGFSR
jgi:hypothetical protein